MNLGARVEPTHSPMLSRLAAGEIDLDVFWSTVTAAGSPLVEPLADRPDDRLVTFVWRGDDQTQNVLVSGVPSESVDLDGALMRLLPGTDVWQASYIVRADLAMTYQYSVNDSLDPEDWRARLQANGPDPLNRRQLPRSLNDANPLAPATVYSVAELPDAPRQPRWQHHELEQLSVTSAALENTRRVWRFRPTTKPQGLLILLDGWEWATCYAAASMLAELEDAGVIPPLAVIMPEARDYLARGDELNGNTAFNDFVADELVSPFLAELDLVLPPERVVVAGQSLGGNGALFLALERPELTRNVIAQSSAFDWPQDRPGRHAGWLTAAVDHADTLPLRCHLDAGLLEPVGLREATRAMASALGARGVEIQLREFCGNHSYYCWRALLPDALAFVMKGWT